MAALGAALDKRDAESKAREQNFSQNSASAVSAWMLSAFDSEYYLTVCFQTREEKEHKQPVASHPFA
jgi:hypothetical protein